MALVDLDQAATEKAAAQIGAERTLGLAADVTDVPSIEAAIAATVKRFGGLDVVVANTGIAHPPPPTGWSIPRPTSE